MFCYESACIVQNKNIHVEEKFTFNVPVVHMARDVMNLMGANPFRGPLEGVGPKNRDFFGP